MKILTITTNAGNRYNVNQASAVKQRALIPLIIQRLMGATTIAGIEITAEAVKGMLVTLDEDSITQVSNIVLCDAYVKGEQNRVDIEDFQGSMNEYYDLLAAAVVHNLADFFGWLDSENSQRIEQRKKAEKKQKTTTKD